MDAKAARQLGWKIAVEGEDGRAERGGVVYSTTSDDPAASLLRLIDEHENPPAPPDPAIGARSMLRESRSRMLAASDWTQLADAPLSDSDRELWSSYRQQLRDYPNQRGFDPLSPPPWPVPPGGDRLETD